ncbi:hypothetical protein I302_102407 [Kwoniella bestiolae CBS 10118]|uniref:Uncharacterized protein n=1 Tax=Kwoniella bestiolae CBS 10118 TaxID=1296100 RepID=A0AAJ8K400_9TREE
MAAHLLDYQGVQISLPADADVHIKDTREVKKAAGHTPPLSSSSAANDALVRSERSEVPMQSPAHSKT